MDKEATIKYLNFEGEVNKNPGSEPFVPLVSYESWRSLEPGRSGLHDEILNFRSFMVSVNDKDLAMKNLKYDHMYFDGMGHFEEGDKGKKNYVTGESWDHFGEFIVEPLYIYRYWEGLSLSICEPSQRVVHYFNLLNQDNINEWIDPYNEQTVIRILKEEDSSEYVKHELNKLEIKIDYLKDYLSARGSGLIISKFARRAFLFDAPDDVPLKKSEKEVKNGTLWFSCTSDKTLMSQIAEGKSLGQAELHEIFWTDPYNEPRRWDAQHASEFEGGVTFTLSDGEKKEYNTKKGHGDDYFTLISFNPRIMSIFLNVLNYDYEEYSRETLGLYFPKGSKLHVAINPSGQIQAWWGQIAKLSKEYQEQISSFSEPSLNKLGSDHDYIRTTIAGNFPQTYPLRNKLEELKSDINKYFLSKFEESFFNKDSSVEDLKKVYAPYETDYHQLLDIMEQLDQWLLSESRPGKIIDYYNFAEQIDDINQLTKIKSLVSLKLLIKKYYDNEVAENKTEVLKLIKDLRICKAHFKDFSKILDKYKLTGKTPQEIYKKVISDLEEFLEWFSGLCQEDFFA